MGPPGPRQQSPKRHKSGAMRNDDSIWPSCLSIQHIAPCREKTCGLTLVGHSCHLSIVPGLCPDDGRTASDGLFPGSRECKQANGKHRIPELVAWRIVPVFRFHSYRKSVLPRASFRSPTGAPGEFEKTFTGPGDRTENGMVWGQVILCW
jgi:hypothetical protein